jgi:hypothetical protein
VGACRKTSEGRNRDRGGAAGKVPVVTFETKISPKEKILLPLRKARNWGQIGPKSLRSGRKMPRTGRQPYATTDVLPFRTGTRRLRPPDGLSDAAKAAFLDLVTGCPADQFRPCDMPLLCRWAELSVMCEAASVELQASGMLGADGKPSPWFVIYQQATKSLSALALKAAHRPAKPNAEGTAAAGWDHLVF